MLRALALGATALTLTPAQAELDPRIETFENGFVAIADADDPATPKFTVDERLVRNATPALAVAIIENGEIVLAKGYGVTQAGSDEAADADTVFSVGSVSKIVNAALILRLVAEGTLDLDTDINTYLTSWQVPENTYTRETPVTLRTLLSHTAGFTVHGFPDFQPGDDLPTAIETLEGERPARTDPVRVTFTPGERMRYSGGGTTVSQVLVEEVTGLPYDEAARKYVFNPLGMTRSTFANPLPASHGNIARAHNDRGERAALPRGWEAMPEMAASGLWASADDLSAFLLALIQSVRGESDFLPEALAKDMMTRQTHSWHGLGPRLNGEGETFVFHHGGANDSYRAWIEGHPETGDGALFFANSRSGHFILREARLSAARAFDWAIDLEDGYEEPEDLPN